MDKERMANALGKSIRKTDMLTFAAGKTGELMTVTEALDAINTVLYELCSQFRESKPESPEGTAGKKELTDEEQAYLAGANGYWLNIIAGKNEEIERLGRLNERFLQTAKTWHDRYIALGGKEV